MLREVRLAGEKNTYLYREEDKIGEGGFGVVYQGQEICHGEIVAVKRPHFDNAEALKRFILRDCRYLPRLRHPHIVRVLAVFTAVVTTKGEAGAPALVMEYIAGQSLEKSWSQLKDWPESKKLLFFCKICQAVVYAHQKGIIHRDLKPGNILINLQQQPKIIDFGLAASLQPEELVRLTRSKHLLGSLLYMSPEQQAAIRSDEKSDIYSLGLILFFIFTGKNARELILQGEHSLVEVFHSHLPPNISQICQQACQREPSQRFASTQDLVRKVTREFSQHSSLQPPKNLAVSFKRASHLALFSAGVLVATSLKELLYQTDYWNFALLLAGILFLWGQMSKRDASWQQKWDNLFFLGFFCAVIVANELIQSSWWGAYLMIVSLLTSLTWLVWLIVCLDNSETY